MVIQKVFAFKSLNTDLSQTSNIDPINEKPAFFLNIANKATYLVHRALKIANINGSQFTSSTKTKSEVRGGGRKPWKQKGTGNARAGSKSSPLWRGGGVTFGPTPRIVYKKLNKKEKRLALTTLIYNKRKNFYLFDNFEFEKPKTSLFLKKFNLINNQEKILVVSSKSNENLKLSIRNCKNIKYILAYQLNITELAKANKIFLEQMSFNLIKELYSGKL